MTMPLLLGGLLYLGFRGDELLMFHAARELGVERAVDRLREILRPLGPSLPTWAVYSLPHALWTFSMLAFFAHVWRAHPAQRRLWVAGAVAGSAGSELLQATPVIPGTFSIPDLLGIACACLAYALLARLRHKAVQENAGTLIFPSAASSGGAS